MTNQNEAVLKGHIQPTVSQLNRSGLVFAIWATSLKAYLVVEKFTSLWKSLRLWVLKVIYKGRETSATLHHPRLHSLCVNLTSKWLFSSCEHIGRVQFMLLGPHLCKQSRSTPLQGWLLGMLCSYHMRTERRIWEYLITIWKMIRMVAWNASHFTLE